MVYGSQAPNGDAQPWILLGFYTAGSQQKAVYGPPGAQFDWIGNVYIEHEGGSKEYVTPYRGWDGKVRQPPQPEDECCGFWHWIGYRTDYHWQSTRFQPPTEYK